MDITDSGIRIPVSVSVRASRNEVTGARNGALHVRLSAPPVEGKANEELISLLARFFGIRAVEVEIVRGHASRRKVVRIRASVEQVNAVLATLD